MDDDSGESSEKDDMTDGLLERWVRDRETGMRLTERTGELIPERSWSIYTKRYVQRKGFFLGSWAPCHVYATCCTDCSGQWTGVPTWCYRHSLKPNPLTLVGSELVWSWFEAGSKLVRTNLASNLSATSFEPDSGMEFGFYGTTVITELERVDHCHLGLDTVTAWVVSDGGVCVCVCVCVT